jgi:hypothetical protein
VTTSGVENIGMCGGDSRPEHSKADFMVEIVFVVAQRACFCRADKILFGSISSNFHHKISMHLEIGKKFLRHFPTYFSP